jgi:histidine triad (HIT) family protein
MTSIFTKIINRQLPAHIIAEDEKFIAFLDIHPIAKGHTLVVPKVEVDYIFDLDDTLLREIMIFTKLVSRGIQAAIPCVRIGVAIVGLEVPHAHLHLVPLNSVYDIDFSKPSLSFTNEELAATAKTIQAKIK